MKFEKINICLRILLLILLFLEVLFTALCVVILGCEVSTAFVT